MIQLKKHIWPLLFLIFQGCEGPYISPVPDYPVSLNLNLTANYPIFKNSVGQQLVFTKPIQATDLIGYGGILVCTGIMLDSYGNTQYFAFDLACPHEVKTTVRVAPLPDRLGEVKCPECGTVYNVGYGFGEPVSGPSKHPLKRYKTQLQNDFLYIYR